MWEIRWEPRVGTSFLLAPDMGGRKGGREGGWEGGREKEWHVVQTKAGHPPSSSSNLIGLSNTALMKISFCKGMTGMSMFKTESRNPDKNSLEWNGDHSLTHSLTHSFTVGSGLTQYLHRRISVPALAGWPENTPTTLSTKIDI